jgi:hypothetical protein
MQYAGGEVPDVEAKVGVGMSVDILQDRSLLKREYQWIKNQRMQMVAHDDWL